MRDSRRDITIEIDHHWIANIEPTSCNLMATGASGYSNKYWSLALAVGVLVRKKPARTSQRSSRERVYDILRGRCLGLSSRAWVYSAMR